MFLIRFTQSHKKADDLLILNMKNNDMVTKETKTKPQERLKCKITKSIESVSSDTPLKVEETNWMLEKTSLETYLSVFNTNETKI